MEPDTQSPVTANVAQLSVLILAVPDLETGARFYESAFAWPVLVREVNYVEFSVANEMRFGLYRSQGFALHTGQVPLLVPEGELAPVELYFHVNDLDTAITRLRGAGARQLASVESKDWGDDAAYFADPFGNVVVVAHRRGQGPEKLPRAQLGSGVQPA